MYFSTPVHRLCGILRAKISLGQVLFLLVQVSITCLSKVGWVPTASPDVCEVYVLCKVQVPEEAAAMLGLAMPIRPTGLKFSSYGQDRV